MLAVDLEPAILEQPGALASSGTGDGDLDRDLFFGWKYIKKLLNSGSYFWVQIWTQKWVPDIKVNKGGPLLGPDLDPKMGPII